MTQDLSGFPYLIAFIPFNIDINLRNTFRPKNVAPVVFAFSAVADNAVDVSTDSNDECSKNVFTEFSLNMPVKEFHSYVKANILTDSEIRQLIIERRKHKNRGYSKASRLRKKNSAFAL